MTDWIYDRQVKRAEAHWRNQRQKTLPLEVPVKAKKTTDGITYLPPPYAARHPAPPVVDAALLAPWEEETEWPATRDSIGTTPSVPMTGHAR